MEELLSCLMAIRRVLTVEDESKGGFKIEGLDMAGGWEENF